MKPKQIGEFGLIRRLSEGCVIRRENIVKAIGDDAAVFRPYQGEIILFTTDMLLENVHFLRNATSGYNLGYKSLAVNLSDIAAMGGTAREAFCSIAIPDDCDIEFVEEIYDGMKSLAADYRVNILGGDTTSSEKGLIINLSVVGSAVENKILYRSNARSGDKLFITGFLGDSRAGCYLITNEINADSENFDALITAHLLPRPYLREGRFLGLQKGVHASIDVSDGLSSDLGHILEESEKGAKIFADKIPISQNLKEFCSRFSFDPVDFALSGGEDYTLLFTVARENAEEVLKNYEQRFSRPFYEIGEVNDSNRMELVFSDGSIREIRPKGWDHFSK